MSPYLPLLWTHNSDATTYTRIAGNKIVKFEKEKQTNKKTFRFVEHVDFEVKEGPTTEEAIWLYQIYKHSAQESSSSQFRSFPLHLVTLPKFLLVRDPTQLTNI